MDQDRPDQDRADIEQHDNEAIERLVPKQARPPRRDDTREAVVTVLVAVVIALVVRWLLLEIFVVSGTSMVPTLHDGDRLLVNKLVYHTRLPRPGEIIVFAYPLDPSRDFIKRVLAVAGDTVEMRGGRVFVNGRLVDEPYIVAPGEAGHGARQVPPGSVWVLGDNRNNSDDSRFFGPVESRFLRGKAFFRFWPISGWHSFR